MTSTNVKSFYKWFFSILFCCIFLISPPTASAVTALDASSPAAIKSSAEEFTRNESHVWESFVSLFSGYKVNFSEVKVDEATRTGTFVFETDVPENMTKMFISIFADPNLINEPRALSVMVEQIPDEGDPWIFGAMNVNDIRGALMTLQKKGKVPEALTLTLSEQIIREDVVGEKWKTRREIFTINDTYHQMAIERTRITIRVYNPITGKDADLLYSVKVAFEDQLPVGLPSGHHSASLVGTFTGAETSFSSTITSGSRTSVSGSLIVAAGGSWALGGTQNNVISDQTTGCVNPCNTWTEQFEFGSGSGGRINLAYNIGGTRGVGHTITNAMGGVEFSQTVGGGEFSGVAASPTVVSNTTTGTSGAPSVAVSASANSLFVGVTGYEGTATTITENTAGGWALAVEADENNNAFDFNLQYKGGITGSQTASWTLGGSRLWLAGVAAFTEASVSGNVIKMRGRVTIRGKVKYR